MPDPEAERAAISAAMGRLLNGTPQRSTGALSMLQLANEAGVKRWLLTHKHTDLAEEFRRRARHADGVPPAFSGMERRLRDLEQANIALRKQNSQLCTQVGTYAGVVRELHNALRRLNTDSTRVPLTMVSADPARSRLRRAPLRDR
ncbi:hypothetical protein [Nocardia sp. A7]|uniref:hypothetical protein n=1 Tax=Nocardia sp. A7 TaxID=2789274 RepID=UPI00397939AC